MTKNIQNKIKNLPQSPGVYKFLDKSGRIIYVGKAVNLRRRVTSYFTGAHDRKTTLLVSNINRLEIEETPSALEAMILEANLIKKYNPIYNIASKDDKSYLYLWISKGDWPRVATVRATDLHNIPEKNPRLFGPYTSAVALKSALEIIRPIIPYRSCKTMPKSKCLYGHLGLCPAPCISPDRLSLRGGVITDKAIPRGRDCFGVPRNDKIEGITKKEYRNNIDQLIAFFRGNKRTIVQELKRDMKIASKNNHFEKAALLRDKIRALEHIKDVAMISADDKPTIYKRIEGYDISNISGIAATGSMVVFQDGQSEKSEYRKFKIKNVKGANDTAMMAEVLERRSRHNDWPIPDLIVIDGGEGQLSAAAKALVSSPLEQVPMVAIAKGPQRKRDDFRFRGRVPERNLKLFKQVRDEAHRFAIGYYRKLHRKTISE